MKPALQFLQSELGVDPPTLPSLVGISSYRPGVGVASKGWSRHWLLEMSFVRACLLRLSAGLGADPLLGSAHVDSGVQTPPQSVFFCRSQPFRFSDQIAVSLHPRHRVFLVSACGYRVSGSFGGIAQL